MKYNIVHTAVQDVSHITAEKMDQAVSEGYVVDTYEGTFDDAVLYAQMTTERHAENIGVTWTPSGNFFRETGGMLTTNNDTRVWYTAKEQR